MKNFIEFFSANAPVIIKFTDNSGYKPTDSVMHYLLTQEKAEQKPRSEQNCEQRSIVILAQPWNNKFRYYTVDADNTLLSFLDGKWLITPQDFKDSDHPIQCALKESEASQCLTCIPNILMSMLEIYKDFIDPSEDEMRDYIDENICQCTDFDTLLSTLSGCCKGEPDIFSQKENMVMNWLNNYLSDSFSAYNYHRPLTIEEALKTYRHSDSTVAYSPIGVARKVEKSAKDIAQVIDLSAIEELQSITLENDGTLICGTAVSVEDLRRKINRLHPPLCKYLRQYGSHQECNIGALAENISTGSSFDYFIPALEAYNVKIKSASECDDGKVEHRTIPLENFYKNVAHPILKSKEIITSFVIPNVDENTYIKLYNETVVLHGETSPVSLGIRVTLENGPFGNDVKAIKIFVQGLELVSIRASKTEKFIIGKDLNDLANLTANEFLPYMKKDFSEGNKIHNERIKLAANIIELFFKELNRNAFIRHY